MSRKLAKFVFGAALVFSQIPSDLCAQTPVALKGAAAESQQNSVRQKGKELMTMAARVANEEPRLYANPIFKDEQAWTLKYQGMVKQEEFGDFKRILVVQPRDVRFQQLEKAFVKYGKTASTLLPDVFENIAKHRKMYVDANDELLYVERFNQALPTFLPTLDGALKEFKPLSCDYVSQPTNVLWFSVNAMRLIDQYGDAIYGAPWTETSRDLKALHSIRDLSAFQEAFAQPIH